MRKLVLVLALGLGLVSCTTVEVQEADDTKLVEILTGNRDYQYQANQNGIRFHKETMIYDAFEQPSECYMFDLLSSNEHLIITSDEDTYSFRVEFNELFALQHAFRLDGDGNISYKIYIYDVENEEHTLSRSNTLIVRESPFNSCNN